MLSCVFVLWRFSVLFDEHVDFGTVSVNIACFAPYECCAEALSGFQNML